MMRELIARRWRLLLILIFVFNVAPWALWVATLGSSASSFIHLLIIPAEAWIDIPGTIFQSPFFSRGYDGHIFTGGFAMLEPVGIGGWYIAIVFWTFAAMVLWLLIAIPSALKQHHLTNR
jgi:hypothetical protein